MIYKSVFFLYLFQVLAKQIIHLNKKSKYHNNNKYAAAANTQAPPPLSVTSIGLPEAYLPWYIFNCT